jgi:hypothetical protein
MFGNKTEKKKIIKYHTVRTISNSKIKIQSFVGVSTKNLESILLHSFRQYFIVLEISS